MADDKGTENIDRESWILIKQGAEARIYRGEHSGKPVIIKERFSKSYRVPALDHKLTSRRMNQEVRAIARCQKNGIKAPQVYRVDNTNKIIYMECIEDRVLLKDYLIQLQQAPAAALSDSAAILSRVMQSVGNVLSTLHNTDMIHGDLTTSNMFYDSINKEITLIDFGLSFVSSTPEDKAVDLYVLERAFISTHPNTESLFQKVLESYKSLAVNGEAILKKLDEVRTRGRKRTMVG